MNKRLWNVPLPFLYVLSAAILLITVSILQDYINYSSADRDKPFNWFLYSGSAITIYLLWLLFCPIIYQVAQKIAVSEISYRSIAMYGGLSILLAFAHRTLLTIIGFSLNSLKEGYWVTENIDLKISFLLAGIFSSFITYWMILGLFLAIDYHKKYRDQLVELARTKSELSNAQLSALKMQLQPHFLFNTLHTISSMMDENVEKAQKMISQMGYLLRKILDQEQETTISLSDEIKYIRSYLDIEQARFRDRLDVRYELSENTLGAQVPNLILQPVVENAVKHGFSKRTESGFIRICSRRFDGQVELVVQDDGHGVADASTVFTASGIGLKNVQKRLQQLYKENFSFEIESSSQSGFTARIVIPYTASSAGGE